MKKGVINKIINLKNIIIIIVILVALFILYIGFSLKKIGFSKGGELGSYSPIASDSNINNIPDLDTFKALHFDGGGILYSLREFIADYTLQGVLTSSLTPLRGTSWLYLAYDPVTSNYYTASGGADLHLIDRNTGATKKIILTPYKKNPWTQGHFGTKRQGGMAFDSKRNRLVINTRARAPGTSSNINPYETNFFAYYLDREEWSKLKSTTKKVALKGLAYSPDEDVFYALNHLTLGTDRSTRLYKFDPEGKLIKTIPLSVDQRRSKDYWLMDQLVVFKDKLILLEHYNYPTTIECYEINKLTGEVINLPCKVPERKSSDFPLAKLSGK